MGGKTRYDILRDALKAHEGELLHVEKLKQIVIRSLGTSGTTINGHLRWAQEAGMIHEEEAFMFRVIRSTEPISENVSAGSP